MKKDGKHIEPVLMNLNTPYDILYSCFHATQMSHKQDGRDFTFDTFYYLLIKYQQDFLEEGNSGRKNQAHLLKRKVKLNLKEHGWKDH